jgi:hypothetical protein
VTNHGDPRSGVDWRITDGPNLPVFKEFFDSISRADATIKFAPFAKHRNSLQQDFDVLIIDPIEPVNFAAARDFIKSGGGVVVLADYFHYTSDGPTADIATRELTASFGIKISQCARTGSILLASTSHPITEGIGSLYVFHSRGEYTLCSDGARPVLNRSGEGKPWAAAWDGSHRGQGRLLVVPDTGFWWGNHVRDRAARHFTFWTRAFRWLAGSKASSSASPLGQLGDVAITQVSPTPLQHCAGAGVSPGERGEHWAVVIGISTYRDTRIPSLRYASDDARAFYDWLTSPAGGRYAPARVRLLLDEKATGGNTKDALFNWLGQALEEDIVTIYFACHGSPQSPDRPDNLFLLPYDANYSNVATTGFPMWDIETALKRFIKAKRVVVIADACHSGGVGQAFDIARRANRGLKVNPISSGLQNLSKIGDGVCVISEPKVGWRPRGVYILPAKRIERRGGLQQ